MNQCLSMYDDGILGLYTCLSSVLLKYFIGTFPNILCLLFEQMRALQTLAGVVVVLVKVERGKPCARGKKRSETVKGIKPYKGINTQDIERETLSKCPVLQ